MISHLGFVQSASPSYIQCVTTTAAPIVGGAVLDGGTPIAIEFTIT